MSIANFEQFLEYRRDEGVLYWKNVTSFRTKVGDKFGAIRNGYLRGDINGVRYRVSAIIYFLETGVWADLVDHLDGDPLNNHISNLRMTDQATNMRNAKKKTNNKSGITGVLWHVLARKWKAYSREEGKEIHIGLYKCKYEAMLARLAYMNQDGIFTDRHGL